MNKMPKRVLSIILCLSFVISLCVSVSAVETHDVFLDIDSALEIEVYDESGETISLFNGIASLSNGIYHYALNTGATGYFYVDDKTTTIKFSKIDFYNVLPTADPSKPWFEYGTLTVTSKDGQHTYTPETESPSIFYVPQMGLEYYYYTFIPTDSTYLTIKGKLYANTDLQTFPMLNLSDAGRIHLIEKNIATVIAPKDMEVWLTWQLKFYTERNYELQEPYRIEGDYAYYTMHVPEGTDNNMAAISFMLRQDGKITRYGWDTMVGTWDTDHTVFTLDELCDSSSEITDAYEANLLTNLPLNSHIKLSSDGYYDIAPLRAVQATNQSNRYNDPEWHYLTLGDSVEIEKTAGDEIWQYGLVKAKKQGTSLVLFWYDAMESPTVYNSNLQQYKWQGVWPELTGVAVVTVSDDTVSTVITPNIDMTEGRVVYYQSSQTSELGEKVQLNDHAVYSFSPTATNSGSPVAISRVRVHDPIMAINGVVNCGDDWLSDGAWTEYESVNGSYTINLKKGRSLIEITAADGTVAYHVITALPVDITISNATAPDTKLTDGTIAKIEIDGVLVPMYKLSAVYNPSRNALNFLVNGREVVVGMGQYLEQPLTFTYSLTEDDIGTVTFADCAVGTAYWGAELNAHRYLGRFSMEAYWDGGDNPEYDLGKIAYFPDFSFFVSSNENAQEVAARNAGLLEAVRVYPSKDTVSASVTGADFASEGVVVPQNNIIMISPAILNQNKKLLVGALPINQDNAILLIRYWLGTDSSTAVITEIPISLLSYEQDQYNADLFHPRLDGTVITDSTGITKTQAMSVEIMSIPAEGYPRTYGRYLYHAQGKANAYPPLGDLSITAAEGSEILGQLDGVLKADPITYFDSGSGESVVLDFGYGFIGTESNFSTSVPYGTEEIIISATACASGGFGNSISITSKSLQSVYSAGEAVPLVEGLNQFEVTYSPTGAKPTTYYLNITRRAAPKTVSFILPDGAYVMVTDGGRQVSANDDGTYTLDDGTYTYYVSMPGYETEPKELIVTEDRTITVNVEDLTPIPEQIGSVTVRIAGQDAVIVPEETVEISDSPADLAKLRYVRYNHGGYTVLHALIDACEPVPFTCRNGSFVPEITIDETGVGPKAGWVCRVNGAVCADPANTLVNGGDKIDFYYDSDYADMLYARFTEEAASVTEGSDAELTLTVGGDADAPIAEAEIYIGETLVGVTDSAGKITVPAELLPEKRSYFVTAESKNDAGQNILTCAAAIITVEKDENKEPANPGYTTVTFRLIGDTKHGDETQYHAYSTWIGTTSYAFDSEKVSVGDVFQRALTEAGLTFVGLNKNYIESIVGPDGDILEEFSNGVNSGWMFTVNGIHSGQGLNNIYVTDGDEIVWHFVDDYILEVMDNYGGSSGNTSVWNTWFDAPDGPSINAGLIVAIDGAEIARENNAFTATLPVGSAYPTAAEIHVTPEDKAATVSALTGPETDEEGETWAFSVTAESGKTVNYTLKVVATVVPVTGVTLSETQASVAVGKTLTLTATVEPEDATDPTVTWLSSDESIATVEDGVVTGVKAGTATITAQAGDMTASCVVTVTAPAPAAPENVEAAAAAGKITLSWGAVEGAAKYLIQRRSYDGSAWSSYATLKTLTGTSYVDAAVTAGSRYQYRVRAYNGSAWGKFGTAAAVTVPAPAPAAPVISAAAEDGKVTVTWAAVDNATKYAVYRRAYVSGAWESVWTQFTATEAGYADDSVTASTKYQYRVRAYGPGGWSGFSNALTVTTPAAAPTVPAAPTGVTAATTNGSKIVTLSWDAAEDADSFVIYRRAYNNETASWGGWEQFTSSTNGYVDEGADYGTIYKYRVKARNAVGLSKTFSEDATAKTPPATPTTSDVKVETGKVTVSWGAVSGATRYQVFRRVKEGNRWGAMTRLITTTETSYVDTTAEAGTVYQYLVKSYNGGYSSYSAGKQITAE